MLRGLDKGQRAALLISECQQGVIDPALSPFQSLAAQAVARNIVPRIARLAQCFRDAELPVIHLHVVHRPGYPDLPRTSAIIVRSVKDQRMIAGSQDVLAVDELQPHPTDIVHARSFALVAFHGTELDAMLRHMGVQTLVAVGVSTNVAISGLSLCGSDLGYQVVVPEDCIAGASAESHEFILRNLLPLYSTVCDSDAVVQAIS
ncbi:Isochorismatase family protein YecD [compost metagenome]|jgi:nicotinamidase-related amidase|uniref:cysteine hydrolase family protein n=1 Tax=Metapseudomonas furukawaii TaxID=1149133 RepID=UPI00227AD98D|nr:cysteine hydrolase [Pseudomonas furukawaii]WAG81112.1 cysteine hydrolase [Pseudomonas furukawaii]